MVVMKSGLKRENQNCKIEQLGLIFIIKMNYELSEKK